MNFERPWVDGLDKEERKKGREKVEALFEKIKEDERKIREKEHPVFYGDEEGVLKTEPPKPEWKELFEKSKNKIKVGSFVQWVNQGVEQWTESKRVVHLSEDGQYAFFDGSMTGVPVSQLEIV